MKRLWHRTWYKLSTLTICFCVSLALSFAPFWTVAASMPTVAQTPSTVVFEAQLQAQIAQAQELQSLGFYRRALLQLSDLDLPGQPDSPIKVRGLHLLSDLQRTVGDLAAAKVTIENAIATTQAINAQTPNAIEIAPMLLSLGHIAAAAGDIEQALEQYESVSAIASDPQLKLRSHLSQLPLLTETDNQPRIEALYADIQSLIERLPVNKITVNARLELARHYIENSIEGDIVTPQVIAQNLATARDQAQTLADSYAESYALGYLGELYLEQQQLSNADTALSQALEIAEAVRSPELAYQWQWALGKVHVQQNRTALALGNYENAADSLKTLRGNLIAIAPDLRFDFREQVEPVYREWVDLLLSSEVAGDIGEETAAGSSNLRKAQIAIESLQLAELENYFAEPCVPLSQDISQIIENTTSPTAVLYPIILPGRLEILLKLPDQSLQQYTVAIAQLDLEALLNQLQIDLRLPFSINQLRTLSAQLYDLLIRPTQPALAQNNIDTLVFVLDGSLRNVPMAALYDGQQYLIENYSIALAPGLQLVAPQPIANRKLTTLIAGLSEARHGFSTLPFVKAEVSQVQQTTSSRVLLNEDFTEDQLTTLLNSADYQVVHLATHGQFSSDAEDTFILAWDKPIQVDEFNTLLRQSDQTSDRVIELLILSACETALGDRRAALGIAGVAVQAGARSTLATLWNLDDETGALFSNYFYQALQQPDTSKAQALRLAQLQILSGGESDSQRYQHPRYWASYILLGNWL
ncbi:CHAT domain-containing protein [cf. Phormidesmis sp. LEGE 11477]|uniref:CHAT domain-containing protein n=1 Tax=cf. Phormidesmis sp. LEGE 11477 TaxID=1828680 RepID=UPI0018813740|nr:CHAT domain-containing protein [cf. Phormidesmis sp. LEGE 11477]MBE9060891.1 CHAT domain-containing protein [cf. Phormidesmis sp. LEGE 11477]